MGEKGDGNEYQKCLISLEILSNTNAVVFKDIQAFHEEKCGCKVNSERNGDVTGNIGPAADPGRDATTPWW